MKVNLFPLVPGMSYKLQNGSFARITFAHEGVFCGFFLWGQTERSPLSWDEQGRCLLGPAYDLAEPFLREENEHET